MINSSISLEDLNNIFSVARNDLQLIEDLTAAGNDERAAFNTLREHSHAISALISALLGEGREVEDEVVEDVESDEVRLYAVRSRFLYKHFIYRMWQGNPPQIRLPE